MPCPLSLEIVWILSHGENLVQGCSIHVLVTLKLNVLSIFSHVHVPTLDLTQEYSQNTYHGFHPMNCFFIIPTVCLRILVLLTSRNCLFITVRQEMLLYMYIFSIASLCQAGSGDRSAPGTGLSRPVSPHPSISSLDCHGTGHYRQRHTG